MAKTKPGTSAPSGKILGPGKQMPTAGNLKVKGGKGKKMKK